MRSGKLLLEGLRLLSFSLFLFSCELLYPTAFERMDDRARLIGWGKSGSKAESKRKKKIKSKPFWSWWFGGLGVVVVVSLSSTQLPTGASEQVKESVYPAGRRKEHGDGVSCEVDRRLAVAKFR